VNPVGSGSSELNLFLVFGIQQLLAVRSIIEKQKNSGDGPVLRENLCLLYIDVALERPLDNCKVEYCKQPSLLAYLRGVLGFRGRVRQWLQQYDRVHTYFPHAYFYPANYLLFADLELDRYLIPDGVINYCEYDVDSLKNGSMILRWCLGLLAGLPYRLYQGHVSAIESGRYDGVYTFNRKGLLTTHNHLVELTLPGGGATGYRANRNTLLFLDHYLQDVPRALQDRIIKAARRYVDDSSADKMYLKKHPSWNAPDNAVLGSVKCEVLTSTEPAEALIERLQPVEVISYASSALVTITDAWPECQCTAIGLNLLQELPDYREVARLFRERGIKMVDAA
jgi:hypothetical protein